MILATKLRPYFEAHIIEIKTNYLLQNVLHRPELSGQLSIWSVILLAYDIIYVLRNAMKAQALTDFVAKMTLVPEALEPTIKAWQAWVGRACGVGGLGIGILLQGQAEIKL